jgi:mannose-6-phosphate isomerase-like protein (cupin superfamily)
MTRQTALMLPLLASAAAFSQQNAPPLASTLPLAQRIGHYDPARVSQSQHVHSGAGSMAFGPILGANSLSTNLIFMHRGVINPHSGIGEHFHNHCEEMFVILDGGDAQFTINGRTSVLPTPAGAPDRMGSAHAIYNPGDTPIQWLNINVGLSKTYDTFDLSDDRVGAQLDKVPQFVNFHLDSKLLRPAPAGLNATGAVLYRRLLDPTVFFTTWSYFDQIVIPAGAGIAPVTTRDMSEAYYVLNGAGTVTVNGESAGVRAGDAIPVDLGQTYSFAAGGSAPLELLAVGVARDMASKEALIDTPVARGGGGRGASGQAGPGR